MVAAHLRQHDHHGLGAAAHAWPGPVDQKSDLGEIIFVIDGPHAVDPSLDQPCREFEHRDLARRNQGIGDIERQRVVPQEPGERSDPREGALAARYEGRGDRKNRHPREKATSSGDDPIA